MKDVMEYWRNEWNKAADHTKATDRSRLFRKPTKTDNSKTKAINIKNILGKYYDDISDNWEVLIASVDDFVGNGTGKNCFDNVRLQLLKNNVSVSQDASNSIFIYYAKGNRLNKKNGAASSEVIGKGLEYLITEILNNRPVAVCVDYMPSSAVNRCGGDHWIAIVGLGMVDNEFYFRFFDNFTSHQEIGTEDLLRLYWNGKTLTTIESEAKLFDPKYQNFAGGEIYTVTAIRRNIK